MRWEGLSAAILPPADPGGWIEAAGDADEPEGGWHLQPFSAALCLTASEPREAPSPAAAETLADGATAAPSPFGATLRLGGALSTLALRLNRSQLVSAAAVVFPFAHSVAA